MAIGNGFIVGWNRAVVGREQDAVELFATVNNYYEARKKAGDITAYEHVFLQNHGGDFNGFTWVQGESTKIDTLLRSEEWLQIEARAMVCLQNLGVIRATSGADGIANIMRLYMAAIPRR
jgi:hypothetical protein